MREADLQDAIIEMAGFLGWMVAHFRPARTDKGWRTPVSADGKGFPDLVMVHPVQRRLLFAELKAEKGKLSPEQQAWIGALSRVTPLGMAELYVWFPTDWTSGEIERCLRGQVDQLPAL